jgi:hypothetical protein
MRPQNDHKNQWEGRISHDWPLGCADELAARVPDGAKIAVPHDSFGPALETRNA